MSRGALLNRYEFFGFDLIYPTAISARCLPYRQYYLRWKKKYIPFPHRHVHSPPFELIPFAGYAGFWIFCARGDLFFLFFFLSRFSLVWKESRYLKYFRVFLQICGEVFFFWFESSFCFFILAFLFSFFFLFSWVEECFKHCRYWKEIIFVLESFYFVRCIWMFF